MSRDCCRPRRRPPTSVFPATASSSSTRRRSPVPPTSTSSAAPDRSTPTTSATSRTPAATICRRWPTDRQGNIVLPSGNTGLTNQNIISRQFLETVNLNRVGGTADETTNIRSAPTCRPNDAVGASHDIDVQFFDTLGNTNAVAFRFSKSATNQWDLTRRAAEGHGAVTLYDGAGQVYRSVGQLEFTTHADGDTIELAILRRNVTNSTTTVRPSAPPAVAPSARRLDADGRQLDRYVIGTNAGFGGRRAARIPSR